VTGVTDDGAAPPGGRTPATLRVAVGLLLLEAVAVTVALAYLIYRDLTTAGVNWRNELIITVFAAIMAVAPAVCGWALARRASWARGPAVVIELMLLPVGWYMVGGGLGWLGVPIFVLGLVGAGALVAPATREALGVK
jgi:hypothetical protein